MLAGLSWHVLGAAHISRRTLAIIAVVCLLIFFSWTRWVGIQQPRTGYLVMSSILSQMYGSTVRFQSYIRSFVDIEEVELASRSRFVDFILASGMLYATVRLTFLFYLASNLAANVLESLDLGVAHFFGLLYGLETALQYFSTHLVTVNVEGLRLDTSCVNFWQTELS